MREVGAFEAKNKFGSLLDSVENGEEVVITRRGRIVARLVASVPVTAPDRGMAAAARIRARGVQLGAQGFDWQDWKALRDDGRP